MAPKKVYVKKTKRTYKKKAPMGSSALAILTKRVNAIARSTQGTQSKCMYQQADVNFPLGNAAGNQVLSLSMNKFSNWLRIFGTDADDEQGKRCIVKSTNFQWNVTTLEPDGIGFSMFAVSLKKSASDLINTSGDLTGLTAGTHYVGNGSKVLLNMNYFNVNYVKRWVMGNEQIARAASGAIPAVQNIPSETASLQKTGKISIPYGKHGMSIVNPSGDWKAGGFPKADTQNHFVLVFTDNSTVDGQNPFLSYNAVHSVLVSA